jgi:excisionase family DNA binding protein
LRTLLTVREVARCLSVSTKSVYALCATRKLRHFRVLNAIRVAPEDLDAFLVQARRDNTS